VEIGKKITGILRGEHDIYVTGIYNINTVFSVR